MLSPDKCSLFSQITVQFRVILCLLKDFIFNGRLYDSVHDAVTGEIIQPYIYAECCRVFIFFLPFLHSTVTGWNLCGPHMKFPPTTPWGSNYDRGVAWVCTCASVCGGLKVILSQASCWAPDGLSLTMAGHRSTLVCVCVCVRETHLSRSG